MHKTLPETFKDNIFEKKKIEIRSVSRGPQKIPEKL